MRLGLVVVFLASAGCGKQLNEDYCAAHPLDPLCATAGDARSDSLQDSLLAGCPAGYDSVAGTTSKYRADDTPALWADAEADCADDGATDGLYTHLVVLSDDAERQALAAVMDRYRHIGHSDENTEGTWLAVTDEPGVYPALQSGSSPPWLSGEPNDTGNCAVMSEALDLYDRDCDTDMQAYLCECDPFPEDAANF